jgi:hypothetical protein
LTSPVIDFVDDGILISFSLPPQHSSNFHFDLTLLCFAQLPSPNGEGGTDKVDDG